MITQDDPWVLTGLSTERPFQVPVGYVFVAEDTGIVSFYTPGGWIDVGTSSGSGGVLTVPNVAALRAIKSSVYASFPTIILEGYYQPADGGGGTLVWSVSDTSADDSGTIFKPNDLNPAQPGRVTRQWSGPYDPTWFGAFGDGFTDDTAAFMACVVAASNDYLERGREFAIARTYFLKSLLIPTGLTMHGHSGMLKPAPGETIKINCAIESAPVQLFDISAGGTITFRPDPQVPPGVQQVNVEWFGAKGDGTGASGVGTDNTIPFQAAIDATSTASTSVGKGGDLLVGRGIFRYTKPLTIAAGSEVGINLVGSQAGASNDSIDTLFLADFGNADEPHGTTFGIDTYNPVTFELVITGLSGMSAASVGGFLYLTGAAHPGNNGPKKIVGFVDPTSVVVTAFRGQAGPAAGGSWWNPQKMALRVLSRDCIVQDITIMAAPGTVLNSAYQTTSNGAVCTNNVQLRIAINGTVNGTILNGFNHADSLAHPGQAPYPPDCENHLYERCFVQGVKYANYYCPNGGGQAKKIVFDSCEFNGGEIAWLQATGGIVIKTCGFGNISEVAILSSYLDQLVVDDVQCEAVARFWRGPRFGSSSMSASFKGGRYSLEGLDPDGTWIECGGPTTITMENVHFDEVYKPDFRIVIGNDTPERPTNLNAIGCDFPNSIIVAPFQSGVYRTSFTGCSAVKSSAPFDAIELNNTPPTSNHVLVAITAVAGTITIDFNDQSAVAILADGVYNIALPSIPLTALDDAIRYSNIIRITWADNAAALTWPANVLPGAGGLPVNPGGIAAGQTRTTLFRLVYLGRVTPTSGDYWFADVIGGASPSLL